MCLICKSWEMGKLTWEEALININEQVMSPITDRELEHFDNLIDRIIKEETMKGNKSFNESD